MAYSHTYNSFTLADSNDSYAWSTENWDESSFASMTLEECAEEAHKEAKIQLALAIENIESDFMESEEYNENDEPLIRNRTEEEIIAELTDDLPYLESHLYWWMVEAQPEEDDQEEDLPITVATSWWFNGAGGLDTLTVKSWASMFAFLHQNPHVELVTARDGIRRHAKWMLDSIYDNPVGGEIVKHF